MSQPRTILIFAKDTLVEDEDCAVRISRGGRDFLVPCASDGERQFWRGVVAGIDHPQRRNLLAKLPRKAGIELLGRLDALTREGWITEELRVGARLLLSRTIISDWYEPAAVDSSRAYCLSKFAFLRRGPASLILESPRCHARLTIGPTAAERYASILVLGVSSGWDADPEPAAVIRMLIESRFLVLGYRDGSTVEDRDPILEGWDFHDLLFHARSRAGRHRDPFGKVDSVDFTGEQSLGLTGSAHRERINLPVPGPKEKVDPDMSFDLVLERRRSVRAAPSEPLTVGTLSEFLFRSARQIRLDDTSPGGSWRPFASAAGRNELAIYLGVHRCLGLTPGLYRYDPLWHAVDRLDASPGTIDRLARYCGTEPIGVHVIIAAKFGRLNRIYRSLAYSLVLRNAGCLLQTMYLVATALGRAPCAIGAGDADLFAHVTGLRYEAQGTVADFVLR